MKWPITESPGMGLQHWPYLIARPSVPDISRATGNEVALSVSFIRLEICVATIFPALLPRPISSSNSFRESEPSFCIT